MAATAPWALDVASTAWGEPKGAVRLFVAGASTHVGKSTVCLALLRHCCERFGAEKVAYIKAATQDERPDCVSAWCAHHKVACVSGSDCPVVYYAGFTRAFLDGECGDSARWLRRCVNAVDELSEDRKVVIIDGVGFPAVGTVCGTSNADVAAALKAPVVLVVKSGVGGAIDAAAYASGFFATKDVPVLGAVLNRAPREGFYARDKVAPPLHAHFARGRSTLYGIVPQREELEGLRDEAEVAEPAASEAAAHVLQHIDAAQLMADAARDPWNAKRPPPPGPKPAEFDAGALRERIQLEARQQGADVAPKR